MIGIWEVIATVTIAIFVFWFFKDKAPQVAKDTGKIIKEFKDGMKGENEKGG